MSQLAKEPLETFVERRSPGEPDNRFGGERRQFSNSHSELSPAAQELANVIDQYKLIHRRRFITYEEMLSLVLSLGYHKN